MDYFQRLYSRCCLLSLRCHFSTNKHGYPFSMSSTYNVHSAGKNTHIYYRFWKKLYYMKIHHFTSKKKICKQIVSMRLLCDFQPMYYTVSHYSQCWRLYTKIVIGVAKISSINSTNGLYNQ